MYHQLVLELAKKVTLLLQNFLSLTPSRVCSHGQKYTETTYYMMFFLGCKPCKNASHGIHKIESMTCVSAHR